MVKSDIQYPHSQINNGTYGDNEEHLCNIPAESGKGDFCQTSKQYPIFGKEIEGARITSQSSALP